MSDGRVEPRTVTGRLVGDTRPAVDSASILLLRDGDEGLEVFMLERHVESDFAGGAYAFPGGKLDPGDRRLSPARHRGLDAAAARGLLGVGYDQDALGLYVAAVRETFEEAGVLLATRRGQPVTARDLVQPAFADARARLAARGSTWDWHAWLATEQLVLDLDALAFWSWWVTPDGLHKRYSTRFFLAVVPPEQADALRHDAVEATDSRWTTPSAALEDQRAGRATIVYPTRQNLAALTEHGSADAAWHAAAAGRTDRRRLQPRIVRVDGTPMIQHPDGGEPEPA